MSLSKKKERNGDPVERAHIKIGPTGSVKNLTIEGGGFDGDADFINNDGQIGKMKVTNAFVRRTNSEKCKDDESGI